MVLINEIQDWVIRQKLEEDFIKSNSQDRVTRAVAEGIKGNNPLPKGRCNVCGREEDKIVPVVMKACITCVNKFMARGGGLKVVNKITCEYFCDYCGVKTFNVFEINPFLCNACTGRLGKFHKFEHKEVIREKERLEGWKKKKGMIL